MLFRNLKSGNIVAAADETSTELMRRSAIYEAMETASAAETVPTVEAAKAEGKSRRKSAGTEPDTAGTQGD